MRLSICYHRNLLEILKQGLKFVTHHSVIMFPSYVWLIDFDILLKDSGPGSLQYFVKDELQVLSEMRKKLSNKSLGEKPVQ